MTTQELLDEGRPYAFWINPLQDTSEHGGFVPNIVFQDETGFRPMTGQDDQQAWVWGKTLDVARMACSKANTDAGRTPDEVMRIVASSMTADPGV